MNVVRSFSFSRSPGKRTVKVFSTGSVSPAGGVDPFKEKKVYTDSAIDLAAINFAAAKMAEKIGVKPTKKGYDGLVEMSKILMKGRSPDQQKEIVLEIFRSMIPHSSLPNAFRSFIPPNQASAEFNAQFAVALAGWLVGGSKVEEGDVRLPDGTVRRQNSTVKIEKCRYLEQAGCVGMCVNMCKRPTEQFLSYEFGMHVHIVPDFNDLSCKFVFGQLPPPKEEDQAYRQPCFTHHCSIAPPEKEACPRMADRPLASDKLLMGAIDPAAAALLRSRGVKGAAAQSPAGAEASPMVVMAPQEQAQTSQARPQ